MNKEDTVRFLIKKAGYSVKSFAELIDIPYSTLLSMLKNGLGHSNVDNVIKICSGLGISVEDLIKGEQQFASGVDVLSEDESVPNQDICENLVENLSDTENNDIVDLVVKYHQLPSDYKKIIKNQLDQLIRLSDTKY